MLKSGREKEASLIRRANRAAAVGKLMMGDMSSWNEYLGVETEPLEDLPRRMLKSGSADVKRNVSREIRSFCNRNFHGMTQAKLERLYLEVAAHRGLEIPLEDFEDDFARVQNNVLRGTPRHATVSISLWGLKFWFPEDQLAKDVCCSLALARDAMEALSPFREKSQRVLADKAPEVQDQLRLRYYSARTGLLSAFNLFESYLNSLAWSFQKVEGNLDGLSNTRTKLLLDSTGASLRKKALLYPEIIGGSPLPTEQQARVELLLDVVKPFRDSLVHPSPFEAPERFGGYDKLEFLSRLDVDTLQLGVELVVESIEAIHLHVTGSSEPPHWLDGIKGELVKEIPTPDEGDRLQRYRRGE